MGALAGTRVLSLAVNLPGPLAAARLAALGADVTKVEPPQGDPLAVAAPEWYGELVATQRVVHLDLKQDADLQVLHEKLAAVDVLVTAMRPSALSRLGLDAVVNLYPRLVHVEIVGHDGAEADMPGHDLTYQAAHGSLQPPHLPLVPVVDVLGAERAVSAALAALISRVATGHGGRVRVVLGEAAHAAAAAVRHGLTGAGTPLGGALPTYRIYPSADGYVALAALEAHFVTRVHQHLGTTTQDLTAAFARESSAHWTELGTRLDIPLVAINPHYTGR